MNTQFNSVVDSLKLLAMPLEQQEQFLPEYADVPDDVTSTYENAFLLLPTLIESEYFTSSSIAAMLRTYNKMQWCLRNVELDDFSNDDWNMVRDLAQKALICINENQPNQET